MAEKIPADATLSIGLTDADLLSKACAYQCVGGGEFSFTRDAVMGMLREVATCGWSPVAAVRDLPPIRTVEQLLLHFRNDLEKLQHGLVSCGRYEDAAKVLAVMIQIGDASECDDFEFIEWPPRIIVERPDGPREFAMIEGG